MLKHRPTDRSHTCRPARYTFSDWRDAHQTVQEGKTVQESKTDTVARVQVSGSDRWMSDCPTTGWCQDNYTMLEHRPTDRSHTYICHTRCVLELDAVHQTAQRGAESNGYRGTEPGERFRSVNERPSHHRVVSGQLHNAQTPANRPLPHVHTTRCVLELDAPDGSAGRR